MVLMWWWGKEASASCPEKLWWTKICKMPIKRNTNGGDMMVM